MKTLTCARCGKQRLKEAHACPYLDKGMYYLLQFHTVWQKGKLEVEPILLCPHCHNVVKDKVTAKGDQALHNCKELTAVVEGILSKV